MSDPSQAGTVSTTLATVPVETIPTPAPAPALPVQSQDPDFIALAEARRDAALEQGQVASTPGPATPPATPASAGDPPTPKPRRQVIPKERFDEVAARAQQQADEILYLKGQLAARQAGGDRPAPATPQGPQPIVSPEGGVRPITDADRAERQAQIQGLRQQKREIRELFDQGSIGMVELMDRETPIDDAIQAVRETDLAQYLLSSVPRPQAPPVAIADQQILDRQLNELTNQHPWSAVVSAAEIAYLREQAVREAELMGKPFGQGPVETLRLRKRIAELASKYGPDWYPNQDPRAILGLPAAATGQTPPSPQPQPSRVPVPPALRTAVQHPPDIHTMGGPSAGTGEISDDRIAAMSEEEIMALPPTVRARILQGA